jgi:hypothetical protein
MAWDTQPMKIAFLLNHEQIHHVAHAVPVAYEMSRLRSDIEVTIVTTTDEQTEQARRFEHRFPAHRCSFRQLGLPAPIRMLGRVIENVAPIRKVAMLRYHARYLTSFDAIVVPEKTSLFLKKRDGRSGPKMIHTRHGAGDRAIGFNEESKQFDFVLLSGPKIIDRLAGVDCLPEA